MTPMLGIMASSISGSKIVTSSFESIATVTAAGGETSLTLSSIPSTFKSIQVRAIARQSGNGGPGYYLTVNATGGFAQHRIYGDGATASADGSVSNTYLQPRYSNGQSSWTTGIFAVSIMDIIDYASTTKTKTIRVVAGGDTNGVGTFPSGVGLTSGVNTAISNNAIASLEFTPYSGTWVAGTSFALYGIK